MKTVTSDSGLLDDLLADGYEFFVGVPDSGLKTFIADLQRLPEGRHVTATWEGEAVAMAAGASLAVAKACVYLQNAGLGHTVNPRASLCIPYGSDPRRGDPHDPRAPRARGRLRRLDRVRQPRGL